MCYALRLEKIVPLSLLTERGLCVHVTLCACGLLIINILGTVEH